MTEKRKWYNWTDSNGMYRDQTSPKKPKAKAADVKEEVKEADTKKKIGGGTKQGQAEPEIKKSSTLKKENPTSPKPEPEDKNAKKWRYKFHINYS